MKDMVTKFFQCDCGQEAIGMDVLEWDKGEMTIGLSFWSSGHSIHYPWMYQLKHIWHIIRKGHPYADEVILTGDKAKEFGQLLLNIAEKKYEYDILY